MNNTVGASFNTQPALVTEFLGNMKDTIFYRYGSSRAGLDAVQAQVAKLPFYFQVTLLVV